MPYFVGEDNSKINIGENISSIKSEVSNLSGEIDALNDSLQSMSYESTMINNLINSIELLNNAVSGFDAGDQGRGKIKDYVDMLSRTKKIMEDVVRETDTLTSVMNTVGYDNNIDSTVGKLVNIFDDLESKMSSSQDYLSHLINNYKELGETVNDINFNDINKSFKFSDDINQTMRGLSSTIDVTRKSTEELFTTLNGFSGSSQVIGQSISSLYESLDNFKTQLNNVSNSSTSVAGLQNYLDDLFSVRENTLNAINDGLRNIADPVHLTSSLGTIKPLMENYEKVISDITSMADSMETRINNNVIYNSNVQDEQVIENAKKYLDVIGELKAQASREYNDFLNQKSQINRQAKDIMLDEVQDPDSEMSRMFNLNMGIDSLNSYSSYDNGFNPINTLVRTSNHIKYSNKEVGDVDNDEILEISKSLQRDLTAFQINKKNIISDIQQGLKSGTDEDLERAKSGLKDLISLSTMITSKEIDLGDLINIKNKDKFNKLPDEVKDQVGQVKKLLNDSAKSNSELLNLGELLGLEKDELKGLINVNDALNDINANLSNVEQKSQNTFGSLKNEVSSTFKDITGSVNNVTRFLGLSALPIPFLGLGSYMQKSLGMASQKGQLSANVAQSYYAMGMTPDDSNIYDMLSVKGAQYHKMSHGIIDFGDYANYFAGLATNVGGQTGISNKQEAADMNKLADNTFLMKKVYGISDSTMQNTIQTFYKELKLSADETSYVMMNMANTATTSNIPVEKYMNTIAGLASNFEKLGLDGKLAMSSVDSLVSQGMSLDKATNVTTGMASILSNFGQNKTLMAYSGIMSGQFNNPWSAIRFGVDKFDSSGKVRKGYGQTVANNIDTWLNTVGNVGGNNEDIVYSLVYDQLKALGMNDQQADIGTSKWLKDKNMFASWVETTLTSNSKNEDKNKVILEGKEELLYAIANVGDNLSAVDKTNQSLEDGQWQLADTLDQTIAPLLGTVNSVTGSMTEGLIELIGKISEFMNSDFFKSVVNPVISNPLTSMALATGAIVGGKYLGKGVKSLASKGTKALKDTVSSALKNKGTNKGFNPIDDVAESALKNSDDVAEAVLNSSDDVYKTIKTRTRDGKVITKRIKVSSGTDDALRTGLNAVDDTLRVGLNAADDVAKGGSKLLGKTGKAGLLTAGAAALGYGAYKLFNGGKGSTDTSDGYGGGLFGRIDTIIDILSGGAPMTQYTPEELAEAERRSNLSLTDNKKGTTNISGPIYAENSSLGKDILSIGAGVGSTIAVEKALESAASKSIAGTAGKTGSTIANIAKKGKLVNSVGKVTAAGYGAAGIVGEAAENIFDLAYHGYKGELVTEDFGKNASDFLVDSTYIAGGAALGTLIGGPVGTAVGALGGYAIQGITDLMTKDSKGNSFSDNAKATLTKLLTGKNESDIELKRSVSKGNYQKNMAEEFKSLGVTQSTANYMVEGLIMNKDKLKDLDSSQQFAVLQKYAEMREGGSSKDEASKSIKNILGDKSLMLQMEEAAVNSIVKTSDNQLKPDQVKKAMTEAIKDCKDILQVGEAREKSYNSNLEKNIDSNKKGTSLAGLSSDEILMIAMDPSDSRYKEALKILEQADEKATKTATNDAEKAFDKTYTANKKNDNKLNNSIEKFIKERSSTKKGKAAMLGYESEYLQDLINSTTNANEKKSLMKEKKSVDEAKEFLENYDSSLSKSMKKAEEKLLKDKKYQELKKTDNEAFYNKVQQEAQKDLSKQYENITKLFEGYEETWIDRIGVELKDGTTTTLDGLTEVTDGMTTLTGATKKLAETIAQLEESGYLNIDNRSSSEFLNSTPQTRKAGESNLKAYAKNSTQQNLGKKFSEAAQTQIGMLTHTQLFNGKLDVAYNDETLIKEVGKSIGLFKDFKKEDLLDSKKYSKASIQKGLWEGDIMYNTKKNGKIDQMGIYIGNGKVVTELSQKEAKELGVGKKQGVYTVDQSYFKNAVRNRDSYSQVETKEEKESKDLENKAARQRNTTISNIDTLNNYVKDESVQSRKHHKDVVNIAKEKQDTYGEIKKVVNDTSLTVQEKQSRITDIINENNTTLIEVLNNGVTDITTTISNLSLSSGGFGSNGGSGGSSLGKDAIFALSSQFESGGDPGKYDPDGGAHSYGVFQMNRDSLKAFIKSMETTAPDWAKKLEGLTPGSTAFTYAWQQIAKEDASKFTQLQKDFTLDYYYEPAAKRIKNSTGLDANNYSAAIQAMVFSTAIQHGAGGANSIAKSALNGKNIASMSEKDIINAWYAARKQYIRNTSLPSSTKQSVLNRMDREQQAAINMIGTSTSTNNSNYSNNETGTFKNGWPLQSYSKISSNYGWRNCPFHGREFHKGIDLAASTGTPVYAYESGKISLVKDSGKSGYGKHVKIDHQNGFQTLYAHLSKFSVSTGQTVSKGQKIGEVGSTGSSTGPHLHFEIIKNGERVNPTQYVNGTARITTTSSNSRARTMDSPDMLQDTVTILPGNELLLASEDTSTDDLFTATTSLYSRSTTQETSTSSISAHSRGYYKKGDRGEGVKQIQTALNNHGHSLAVDGIFGSKTDAAVREFQGKNGLKVDGLVGPKTIEKLIGSSSSSQNTNTSETEEDPFGNKLMYFGHTIGTMSNSSYYNHDSSSRTNYESLTEKLTSLAGDSLVDLPNVQMQARTLRANLDKSAGLIGEKDTFAKVVDNRYKTVAEQISGMYKPGYGQSTAKEYKVEFALSKSGSSGDVNSLKRTMDNQISTLSKKLDSMNKNLDALQDQLDYTGNVISDNNRIIYDLYR